MPSDFRTSTKLQLRPLLVVGIFASATSPPDEKDESA